jgi:hypothetical protein
MSRCAAGRRLESASRARAALQTASLSGASKTRAAIMAHGVLLCGGQQIPLLFENETFVECANQGKGPPVAAARSGLGHNLARLQAELQRGAHPPQPQARLHLHNTTPTSACPASPPFFAHHPHLTASCSSAQLQHPRFLQAPSLFSPSALRCRCSPCAHSSARQIFATPCSCLPTTTSPPPPPQQRLSCLLFPFFHSLVHT